MKFFRKIVGAGGRFWPATSRFACSRQAKTISRARFCFLRSKTHLPATLRPTLILSLTRPALLVLVVKGYQGILKPQTSQIFLIQIMKTRAAGFLARPS